jgi:hypothetical protein
MHIYMNMIVLSMIYEYKNGYSNVILYILYIKSNINKWFSDGE